MENNKYSFWVPIVVLGALLNVAVNFGYKIGIDNIQFELMAAMVMGMASLLLLGFAIISSRKGWRDLLKEKLLPTLILLGFMTSGIFVCFLTALSTGPISLVDPLWVCIYSLTSLAIGMVLIHEKPKLFAIIGIGLYIMGSALMGLSDYSDGTITGNIWALYVLLGATAGGFLNYGFKILVKKIDIFIMVGVVYAFTSLGLVIYSYIINPTKMGISLDISAVGLITIMAVFQCCWIIMMVTALSQGPISLIDPLWACIYALGSVLVGVIIIAETPSLYALMGIVLYLGGAYLMARRNLDKSSMT